MHDTHEELKARIEMLETRLNNAEAQTKQLTELMAGLAQVTQQLMQANSIVVNAAQELRSKAPKR